MIFGWISVLLDWFDCKQQNQEEINCAVYSAAKQTSHHCPRAAGCAGSFSQNDGFLIFKTDYLPRNAENSLCCKSHCAAQFDFKYKGVSEKRLSSAAAANVKNEQ